MKLLIIGAGGYGQLVKDIAELTGRYSQIDFLDDNSKEAIGKVAELKIKQKEYDGCIVAIGNPEIREKVFEEIDNPISVVHPTAVISKRAVVGKGCVVEANAVVNTNAMIKDASYICAGAVINHDAVVSEFCQVDCNAVISAGSLLSKGSKVDGNTVFKSK